MPKEVTEYLNTIDAMKERMATGGKPTKLADIEKFKEAKAALDAKIKEWEKTMVEP
jgi:hypothetical protein